MAVGCEAQPVCASPRDGSFTTFPACSCWGVTIDVHAYADEPFARVGACSTYDGGTDRRARHLGFDGAVRDGELVVATRVAADVAWVLEQVFAAGYPSSERR